MRERTGAIRACDKKFNILKFKILEVIQLQMIEAFNIWPGDGTDNTEWK